MTLKHIAAIVISVIAVASCSVAKPLPQNVNQSVATACDAVREAFLTGTPDDINVALQALISDRSADATAREYAQNYLNETNPDLRGMDKGIIQMSCS